jgi:hypothetical protein
VLVGFHVLERLADVGEGKHLVDRQLQFSLLDRAPDILADFVENLADFLDRAGAEGDGSAMSYAADIDRARRLIPLVKEGFAASLTEAATRFALSHPAMGTIPVGTATSQQFEDALAAAEKGTLSRAALDRLSALRQAILANHDDRAD